MSFAMILNEKLTRRVVIHVVSDSIEKTRDENRFFLFLF